MTTIQNPTPSHLFPEISAVFRVFDRNKDGFITAPDLKYTLEHICGIEKVSDDEIAKMIAIADSNKNGKIGLPEFARLYTMWMPTSPPQQSSIQQPKQNDVQNPVISTQPPTNTIQQPLDQQQPNTVQQPENVPPPPPPPDLVAKKTPFKIQKKSDESNIPRSTRKVCIS